MTNHDLGRRLRSAREVRGLSQQAVADAMSLPRTAVTQIEAGGRSVSSLELAKLAELYLRPVTDFFQSAPGDEEPDVLVALYRIEPGLEDDPVMREQVARSVLLCREGVALERYLGAEPRSGPPSYQVPLPRSTGEAVSQGEEAAEQERLRLGIDSAPIADVSELIASQGIWASGVALPDGVSGLFLQHPSIGLAVLVNSLHPKGRKRFSYAHEYAHALLDRECKITVSSASSSSEMIEKRANAFAAAFLMPRSGTRMFLRNLDKGLPSRQEFTIFDAATGGQIEAEKRPPARSQRITYIDAALLAHHFGVSYRPAVYRLKNLRHVSAQECGALLEMEQLGREYLKALSKFDDVGEPEKQPYWDRELRSEVTHLVIEAYRREEITRGKVLDLSKILQIPGRKLLDLANAARGE